MLLLLLRRCFLMRAAATIMEGYDNQLQFTATVMLSTDIVLP
jgi:hypothetical protein